MKKIFIFLTTFSLLLLCSCSENSNKTIDESEKNIASESDSQIISETTSKEYKYEVIDNPDIRNLKWGMSVEEVKYYETEKNYVEDVKSDYHTQTLLTYSNVSFDGYNTEMTLSITDGFGLDGVNYRIQDDKYEEIYNKLVAEYGKPTSDYPGDSPNANWEIEKDNIWIFLLKYENNGVITQYSFFPLNTDYNNDDTPKETTNKQQNILHESTLGEQNALKRAKEYLNYSSFSYDGLVEQLEFEGYTHSEAVYAADNCGANWNSQASDKAKEYLKYSAFSYNGLVEQLEFEGYSHSDAIDAVNNCGADWNEQAAKKAKQYLEYSSFSRSGLIEQLEFEGFTHSQAVYGAEQNGY